MKPPPSTLMPSPGLRAKNRTEILRIIEEMRTGAGELMREVFPGSLKRYVLPHLPASTISKAREAYVCGAFFRAGLYILALRIGGAPRERAQRLVDHLQEWVDRLWPVATPDAPVTDIVRKAQETDTQEDAAETAYLAAVIEGDPVRIAAAREAWVTLLRQCRADERSLLLALAGGA